MEEKFLSYNSPIYGKLLGTFSSSYDGFHKKWEQNQNFEDSAHFDKIFQI